MTPGSVPVDVGNQPAPRLNRSEATQRLDRSGQPFLFYVDFYVDTYHRRGRLLYRRYDGHYGLIAPLPSRQP